MPGVKRGAPHDRHERQVPGPPWTPGNSWLPGPRTEHRTWNVHRPDRAIADPDLIACSMRSPGGGGTITVHVELFSLFSEFARLLQSGGRDVCITGATNDVIGGTSASARRINEHYIRNVHAPSDYFKALARNVGSHQSHRSSYPGYPILGTSRATVGENWDRGVVPHCRRGKKFPLPPNRCRPCRVVFTHTSRPQIPAGRCSRAIGGDRHC